MAIYILILSRWVRDVNGIFSVLLVKIIVLFVNASNFDLSNSLLQRRRGTTVGFPEASVAELWGFALVVDEESICRFIIWFLNLRHP